MNILRPWVSDKELFVAFNLWCMVWYFIAVYVTFTCLRVASKIKQMAEQLSPWKCRLELLLLFLLCYCFFFSAMRQRGRAQLGITLFYLFLDDLVEPQIVSLWESCIVFNTLKVLQKKNYFHQEHDSSQIPL